MKKAIIVSISLILLFVLTVMIVQSAFIDEDTPTAVTLDALTIEDYGVTESNETGNTDSSHHLTNITDANYTSFGSTLANQTYYYINFTKLNYTNSSSKVQITYNTSSDSTITNYTLSDYLNCFEQDNEKVLLRLNSSYIQNFSTKVIFENITLLNVTSVSLANERVVSVAVFNKTVRVDVVNETNLTNSELVWENNTNMTVLNTTGFDVGTFKLFNCSVRTSVTNETNDTNTDMYWENNTNITLTNTLRTVDTSTVILYNCTSPHTIVPSTNYTAYDDGNVFLINSTGVRSTYLNDGDVICVNYTYLGNGPGPAYPTSNYTVFSDGNIYAKSNETIPDGEDVCVNYTYHSIGFGKVISSTNYSVDYLNGTIKSTDDRFNGTDVGVNYTYHTDATPFNVRECYNGSTWIELGRDVGRPEIFDIRMFWHVASRVLNFSFVDLVPNAYSIQNTTTINISTTIVDYAARTVNYTYFNCSLFNRSSRTANYSANVYFDDVIIHNGSSFNQTITFADNTRTWWYIMCEDEYSRQIANSTVRLFDIDTYYVKLQIQDGVINFTTDTGNAEFQGSVTANSFTSQVSITIKNSSVTEACNDVNAGLVKYNASTHRYVACNSTAWINIW